MTARVSPMEQGARRFGVRAKLLLAFAGIAGMTVAASLVGLMSFSAVEAPLARIVSVKLPEMALAKRLATESSSVAAAAPTLESADSQARRQELAEQILTRARGLIGLVDDLARSRANDPQLGQVKAQAQAMIGTLERQNAALTRRIEVRDRRMAALGDLAKTHEAFLATLAPLVERSGEQLRAKGDSLLNFTEVELKSMDQALSDLIAVYEIRTQLLVLADAGERAATSEDMGQLLTQEMEVTRAASSLFSWLAKPSDWIGGDKMKAQVEDLYRLIDSPEGPVKMRREALRTDLSLVERSSFNERALAAGATVRTRAQEMAGEFDTLVMRARGRIKIAIDTVLTETKDSLNEVLVAGLPQLRAYLELAASGNLLAGALNEAAQAPDAERVGVLRTRFEGAAKAVDERVKALGGSAGQDLDKAAHRLIAFGRRGDINLFALREAELAAQAEAAKVLGENRALAAQLSRTVEEQVAAMQAETDQAAAEAGAAIEQGRVWLIVFAVGSLVGAVLLAWYTVGRVIVARIQRLAEAMRTIAGGQLDAAIPQGGSDEITDMAQALVVFRDTARQAAEATARTEAERARAAEERRRMLLEMADSFEKGVRGVLDRVSRAADEMHDVAERMTRTAEQTTGEAATAAATSQQAAGSVEAVAAATEQLSASIQEIGQQVSTSSRIARQAATDAEKTDHTVEGLSDAAQKIGEVVQLISDIASQTNLLALNATIEAARAGDAGKGFAVVASEVKNLATQTAKATEDIAQQIAAMQTATQESVSAIRSIAGTIREINEIAAAIAASVEQQSAATREIARNVGEAADGTRHVRENIDIVAKAAADAGQSAHKVLDASTTVADEVRTLGTQVNQFVTHMRAG
ncbi:MAG TPA: methyl-accepting chemotaxis protein [Azospirillum sp.]|nr:methyl-accepting chemotaxis protein [Azospirillum sp.]